MYAIVDTFGSQVKVEEGKRVLVPYIDEEAGKEIELDKVLLFSDGKEIQVGQPYLKNVKVKCILIGEQKGKKIIVFKYKKRKRYSKKRGHRQLYSILEIDKISIN